MSEFYLENNADRWPQIEAGSLDFVVSDPPYNASELNDGEQEIQVEGRANIKREFGGWDRSWSPFYTMEQSARAVRPGGWLILCSGDVTFGMIREMGEQSPDTLERYLEFFARQCKWDSPPTIEWIMHVLETQIRKWEYHCTIVWHKTNPVCRYRTSGPQSSVEWVQVLKRLDDKGNSVAGTWNAQPQDVRGHNFIEGKICSSPERLYWHRLPGDGEDFLLSCPDSRNCNICASGGERRSHPTQKPLYLWNWIYKRFTVPGQRGYDPYAGLGGSLRAASKFGLEMTGSEIEWEYWKAGQLWREGAWAPSAKDLAAGQPEMF